MWPFHAIKKEPEKIDLGRTNITIHINGSLDSTWTIEGRFIDRESCWYIQSKPLFRQWLEDCGKTGYVPIGNGRFVPICNTEITVMHESYWVEI